MIPCNKYKRLGGWWSHHGRKYVVRGVKISLIAGLAVAASIGLAEWYVASSIKNRIFDHAGEIPTQAPVLVLGCSPTYMGGPNGYFYYRMDAALDLWKAGKASSFIVSGDNSSHAYNEPEWMKRELVRRGVPEDKIVCDFAGLRTLDSVVRVKSIFRAPSIIIVSQAFHNERALAIARHYDLEAHALNALDVPNRNSRMKSWFRERAARVCMMLDLWVWNREPKFMGESVNLPEEGLER